MLVSLNRENDPSLTYTYMTPVSRAITIYHDKGRKAITGIQKNYRKPSFRVTVKTRYNDRCAKGAVKLYRYFEESLYRNSRYA